MLRLLAALALTFYVIPIQTHAQRNKTTQSSKSDKSPSPIASVAPKNSDSPHLQGESNHHVETNVRVISTPAKDHYDKAAVWINGILGAIGALGIGVAIATLKKIRVQADEMRLQRIAMQDSLEAIKRQADLMREQNHMSLERERAKLRIELEPLSFVPVKDRSDCYRIEGTVSIYGVTEAFIDRSEIYSSIGADGVNNPQPEWHWSMHLDPVLRPNALPSEFSTIIMGADGPASHEEMGRVQEGTAFVYCVGRIEFTTLGQTWILRMRQCFNLRWGMSTPDGVHFLGDWEPDGMTWENQEIRHQPN